MVDRRVEANRTLVEFEKVHYTLAVDSLRCHVLGFPQLCIPLQDDEVAFSLHVDVADTARYGSPGTALKMGRCERKPFFSIGEQ